ncbi:hypothetical protein Tco_0246670 [Tanacetum coccineum]
MHVFIGNFTYIMDFMIIKDISSIIDPRLSQGVLGKPFVEISNMINDPQEGVVRFTNGNDEVSYKMPHKIEQYNSLSNLEKEHTKSVYLRNEEDKRRGVEYVMSKILGFYKECLELGPEYLTMMEDEGEVTPLSMSHGKGYIRMVIQAFGMEDYTNNSANIIVFKVGGGGFAKKGGKGVYVCKEGWGRSNGEVGFGAVVGCSLWPSRGDRVILEYLVRGVHPLQGEMWAGWERVFAGQCGGSGGLLILAWLGEEGGKSRFRYVLRGAGPYVGWRRRCRWFVVDYVGERGSGVEACAVVCMASGSEVGSCWRLGGVGGRSGGSLLGLGLGRGRLGVLSVVLGVLVVNGWDFGGDSWWGWLVEGFGTVGGGFDYCVIGGSWGFCVGVRTRVCSMIWDLGRRVLECKCGSSGGKRFLWGSVGGLTVVGIGWVVLWGGGFGGVEIWGSVMSEFAV